MSERQIAAMEAIFSLCEAVGDDLTINDLIAVISNAVEEGHDKIAIILSMAGIAVEEAKKRKQAVTA